MQDHLLFCKPTRYCFDIFADNDKKSARTDFNFRKKMKRIFLTTLLFIGLTAAAQDFEKIVVSQTDENELYVNDDDATELFYYKFVPSTEIKGVLVLLPSGSERVENTLKAVHLHQEAVKHGIMVIVPSINWGTDSREAECTFLDTIFDQIVRKHAISKDKFILSGLSNGGVISLTYAQKASKNPQKSFLKPKAILVVDAPLDKARFYHYCEREIKKNTFAPAVEEAKWLKKRYDSLYGGSPEKYKQKYIDNSIYSYGAKQGGNARYLKDMPILIFTDLDTDWLINQRHRDLTDWNGIDCIGMINELRLLGNKQAEVIVSQGKGYRLDG
ncbi:hypothetical protein FFWV33_18325 [Flavobacterium faecale]|uniref:Alpha/beta hydrolase n=2 Tax=Flavobacterium faecale TaxID=1355330 RepID=A0A2S1LHT1_9FLAO|nr:hypothetical protein FFWV33_18325 [Flavobacterium faecale]